MLKRILFTVHSSLCQIKKNTTKFRGSLWTRSCSIWACPPMESW